MQRDDPPYPSQHHIIKPQTYGLPNTRDGNTAGDKLLGAAAALAMATGSARADGTCRVANEPELRAAIIVSKGLGWVGRCSVAALAGSSDQFWAILEI